MSFVTVHRVNDQPVSNFYEKVPTQGDAEGFSAEAPGRRAIKDLPQGTTDLTNIEVPFSYLVGQDQLSVYWWFGQTNRWELILERTTYEQAGMLSETLPYYEETSTGTMALYNIGSLDPSSVNQGGDFQGGKILFSVPHTALPGSARNRLVVENQGDNVGIELQGRGDGITFTTPQGKTYLIRPEEDGILTTIPLN